MIKLIITVLISIRCILAIGQSETDLFRGTFYSNFFEAKIRSIEGSTNTYTTSNYYLGKKLDKPRNYEIHGLLTRELQGVYFKYKLLKTEEPKHLQLVKEYHLHIRNDLKYSYLFDTIIGDWAIDSSDSLDSLIYNDILISAQQQENRIGIYIDPKTNKYYLRSDNYFAYVKIKVPKLKGKLFLRRFKYDVDKKDLIISLLSHMHFCDYYDKFENEDYNLDVNCYDLYKI